MIDTRTGARRTVEPPDCPGGAPVGFGGALGRFQLSTDSQRRAHLQLRAASRALRSRAAPLDDARHRFRFRDLRSRRCRRRSRAGAMFGRRCRVAVVGVLCDADLRAARLSVRLGDQRTVSGEPRYGCGPPRSGYGSGAGDRRSRYPLRRTAAMRAAACPARLPPKGFGPDRPRHVLGQVCGCHRPSARWTSVRDPRTLRLQAPDHLAALRAAKRQDRRCRILAGKFTSGHLANRSQPGRRIFLPELRRFTIHLTAAQVRAQAHISALTRHTIYIIGRGPNSTGSPLWAAPLPPPT